LTARNIKKVDIYIDGASRNNPGYAGVGILICNKKGTVLQKISEYIGKVTNNVAEYTALNLALATALKSGYNEVLIKSDSELVVKQLNGDYKVKSDNIKSLYLQAKYLSEGFDKIDIQYVKRSNNKEADKLANKAIEERKIRK
jgi:ribonuclease HI